MGISATGMRDIAQEADLSAGNLYHYFESKDEILLFCQERTLERLLESAKAARGAGTSYAERVRALMRAHVRCMLDELEGAIAHLEVESLPPAMRARVIVRRDEYEHAVRRLVAAGMKRGEFVRADASLVTRAMLGAVNWSAAWYRPGGARSVAEIADAISDFLVRGLVHGASSPA